MGYVGYIFNLVFFPSRTPSQGRSMETWLAEDHPQLALFRFLLLVLSVFVLFALSQLFPTAISRFLPLTNLYKFGPIVLFISLPSAFFRFVLNANCL